MNNITPGFIPFHQDEISLNEALQQVNGSSVSNREQAPFLLRLAAGKVSQQAKGLVHYGLDIQQYKNIHIMLGRGFLPMDEAFSAGFTVGCAKKITTSSEKLNAQLSRDLYPAMQNMDAEAVAVFKDAVKLAYVSNCIPIDNFNFTQWQDVPVRDIRKILGLESELLRAYFEVEKRRYPNSAASQRLLPAERAIPSF